MKYLPKYPSLYQVNIRVWLNELSRELDRKATLDDIPDADLDKFAAAGFDWIWLLSVWQTSELSRKVSVESADLRKSFEKTLDGLKDEDIGGSGFAVAAYLVSPAIGGETGLKRFRERLKIRDLKLMLDFVPNHTGLDHPWVQSHPEYFIQGTKKDLKENPQNFISLTVNNSMEIFAYGRDPHFSGWPDTLQLDYSIAGTIEAMAGELQAISKKCDGVRCDMAMLILPDIFLKTWGKKARSFWPDVMKVIHEDDPDFCFLAEVYWDLEWRMQQLGFDFTYDKRLYDRLRDGRGLPVREHLRAGLPYQEKLARFLENHDEPRAALTFTFRQHMAAAVITYFCPGMRFFHQGQFKGRKSHVSPHLVRAPAEEVNEEIRQFYFKLLHTLNQHIFRDGNWQMPGCLPAWEGNGSHDDFIVFYWEMYGETRSLVAVNYADHRSQCYVKAPGFAQSGQQYRFNDLMSDASYNRDGSELADKGLYLDIPGWGYHIFEITCI